MVIVDAHTHIHFANYEKDRDKVIKRAQEAGVKMVTVGINLKDSQKALHCAVNNPDWIWATVGLHPSEIKNKEWEERQWEDIAQNPQVTAIGECGLDYYKNPSADIKEKQKDFFLKQIKLAEKLNKPLMIHCRSSKGAEDAYDDLAGILAAQGRSLVKIIHFFTGSQKYVELFLKLGCYFTLGGVITFADYSRVVKAIPLDRILVETDAPFVAPVPYRGKRNEPSYVVETLKKIAELKKNEYEKVVQQTTRNAGKVFSVPFIK